MTETDNKKFVTVTIDIYCEWLSEAPEYRLYVNDELFADRTFRWNKEKYLQEVIPLHAPPGIYTITVEPLTEKLLKFEANNLQIEKGKAKRISDREFEIR